MSATGLAGKTFAITRGKTTATEFTQLLEQQGAKTIALDSIEIIPAGPDAGSNFVRLITTKKHHYCAFMSAQAVSVLFGLVDHSKLLSALSATTVIAVGPKTKDTLSTFGILDPLMPEEEFSSLGIVEMLRRCDPLGKSIIIPRSSEANEEIAQSLRKLGMQVDEVHTYSVQPRAGSPELQKFAELLMAGRIDGIAFTSASSVDAFFDNLEKLSALTHLTDSMITKVKPSFISEKTVLVSIGPVTSSALRKRGISRYFEATVHTTKGIVDLLMQIFV